MREHTNVPRTDRLSSAKVQLLRAAGLVDAQGASSAWRSFRQMVPEGQEDPEEQRLLPLVFRNLLRAGHAREPYLARRYAEAFGATVRLIGETRPALLALDQASIRTMVLKGFALAHLHYRDLGVRPMSDADILVPAARAEDALAALANIGWLGHPSQSWLETGLHAAPVIGPSGTTIDLHRHATYEAQFAAADEAFFSDSVPLEVSGTRTSAMSAGDQLLHSVVHGLRWSIAPSSVWILDAITILRGGAVEVPRTVDRAVRLRLALPLERGLRIVRDVLGPEAALDALLEDLSRHPPSIADRLEHCFRVRRPGGVLGSLPNLWFAYRRSAPYRPELSGFGSFLRRAWRLRPDQSLVALTLSKGRRRLATAFARRH